MSEQDASDATGDPEEANATRHGETDVADDEEVDTAERDLDGDVDEELVDRVESDDPASIAREIAALRVEVEGLEAELADREERIADLEETADELESKLARARADFQNYKKRTEERRDEARKRAKADLVERLLDVHDNLGRALEQDEDVDIRGGVESTLQQFDDVLAAENVTPIDPDPGDEVDPHRHEVLVRVESDRPEGTIDDVHRVGYEMDDDVVVREAQVTVSDGSGTTETTEDGEDAAANGDE